MAVRNLIWDGIRFGDNPIRSVDISVADTFEETVWSLLRNEEMDMVDVRFGGLARGPRGAPLRLQDRARDVALPAAPLSVEMALVAAPERPRAEDRAEQGPGLSTARAPRRLGCLCRAQATAARPAAAPPSAQRLTSS